MRATGGLRAVAIANPIAAALIVAILAFLCVFVCFCRAG
jgi:hypothetical protein